MRILISRTDGIGDLVLCFPLIGLLKKHYPHYTVHLLARDYVKDIALAFPLIDQFMCWDELDCLPPAEAAQILSQKKYDIFIQLNPDIQPMQLAKRAKIPTRIATSHKWKNWLYGNHLINFSRKKSSLHETITNFHLLKPFNIEPPKTTDELIPFLRIKLQKKNPSHPLLDAQRFNLILHPGSHGHGQEWPLEYYCQLIQELPESQFKIFVTGSKREATLYSSYLLQHASRATLLLGQTHLQELMHFISVADGLIASGTGPLHLAAALGIRTLGIYPTFVHSRRWYPIGVHAEQISLPQPCQSKCSDRHCACIRKISAEQIKERIMAWKFAKIPLTPYLRS